MLNELSSFCALMDILTKLNPEGIKQFFRTLLSEPVDVTSFTSHCIESLVPHVCASETE